LASDQSSASAIFAIRMRKTLGFKQYQSIEIFNDLQSPDLTISGGHEEEDR
jgi:hypothetical protein